MKSKLLLVFVGLSLFGCGLFEDISSIQYVADVPDDGRDVGTDADLGVQDTDAPDVPPDLPDADMALDLDMTVDTSTCVETGCDSPQICNTVTLKCGPCGANAPCSNGQVCESEVCVCPDNQVFCAGRCIEPSAAACGAGCAACPAGINANGICADGECELECQSANTAVYREGCATLGATCPGVQATLGNACNIVYQTGCVGQTMCSFVLINGVACSSTPECDPGQSCSNGRCLYLESGCTTSENSTIPIGAACVGGTNRCVAGAVCSAGVCQKMCDASVGAGCEANEFCRPLQPGGAAGFCASSC